MNLDLEKILQEINSISRMAIIEEATQTEKMLCNYSKLLKYRYAHQGKTVTVSMELSILRMMFEIHEAKVNGLIQFSVENIIDTNAYFIPHYVILSYMEYILTFLEKHSIKTVDITLNIQEQNGALEIQFYFSGFVFLSNLMSELTEPSVCNEYTCLAASKSRWNHLFGKDSIQLEEKNCKSLILHFLTNSL